MLVRLGGMGLADRLSSTLLSGFNAGSVDKGQPVATA